MVVAENPLKMTFEGGLYEANKSVATPHDRGGAVCRPGGNWRRAMDEARTNRVG